MERKLTELIDKAVSRRTFLAGASVAAASTVITGCSSGGSATPNQPVIPTPPTPQTLTDADYLNFALNLEYLEAEFYLRAATGTGLGPNDTGNATSLTTGGSAIPGLTALQAAYLNEIAQNELDHVRFLRSALGSAAQPAPAIELTASFNTLATAAGLGSTFNPFSSYNNYLIGAFIFEDVGVTAYHGAAIYLTNPQFLTAAAQIHAVEAYHAASIRTQIVAIDAANNNTALTQTANAVETVRASLGGSLETMLSPTSIVPADPKTSIGFARSLNQVLNIVYGTAGANVHSGLFFPKGLNGTITTTSATA